jgi:hypothetical protein
MVSIECIQSIDWLKWGFALRMHAIPSRPAGASLEAPSEQDFPRRFYVQEFTRC